MGLQEPNVAFHNALDDNFTFFVVYGNTSYEVDYNSIKVQSVDVDKMSMEDINTYIKSNIKRKVVVLGASTGSDAHTVGIDAIMNMKGYAGHYGLERYEMLEAYNLGSQVPNEEFIKKAIELKADVLLVSQTVTQKKYTHSKLNRTCRTSRSGRHKTQDYSCVRWSKDNPRTS